MELAGNAEGFGTAQSSGYILSSRRRGAGDYGSVKWDL